MLDRRVVMTLYNPKVMAVRHAEIVRYKNRMLRIITQIKNIAAARKDSQRRFDA